MQEHFLTCPEPAPGTVTVYLDIETNGEPDLKTTPRDIVHRETTLHFVVTAAREEGEWRIRHWYPGILDHLRAYLLDKRVVTWNGGDGHTMETLRGRAILAGFDLPVLVANGGYEPQPNDPAATLDLMALIEEATGCRYGLKEVARAAGYQGREQAAADDWRVARDLWQSGDPAEQERALGYCREDLRMLAFVHSKLTSGRGCPVPYKAYRGGTTFDAATVSLRETSMRASRTMEIEFVT